MAEEHTLIKNKKVCLIDPTHKTYIKPNGREHWLNYKGGYLCKKCYNKIVTNPKRLEGFNKKYNDNRTQEYIKKYNDKRTPEQNKIYYKKYGHTTSLKRITFLNKRKRLTYNPRKGYCSWCSNNIYDDSCYETHIHHLEYFIIFPWFATIELCPICHTIETRRLEKLKRQ